MKRFTSTDKWRDPWFRRLSPRAKLLFLWLADSCDNSGVFDLDLDAASFDIGETVGSEDFAQLGNRVTPIACGKYWLAKFIQFQYGNLSAKCVPHLRVVDLLQVHGIKYPGNGVPSAALVPTLETTLPTTHRKGKEEEEDKDKEREGGMQGGKGYHKDARTVLYFLNEACGKHFRETDSNLTFISARLGEPEVTLEEVKKMITRQCRRWAGTEQAEYLRPETLFNKTKFDSYYASRNESIPTAGRSVLIERRTGGAPYDTKSPCHIG